MNKEVNALIKTPAKLKQRTSEVTTLQVSEHNFPANSWVTITSTITNVQTKLFEHYREKSETDAWISYIKKCSFHEAEKLSNLEDFSLSLPEYIDQKKYSELIEQIDSKIKKYNIERHDSPEFHSEAPSHKSLYELIKFLPQINKHKFEVYIDPDSGNFGVSFSRRSTRFNLSIKENQEILFSLVKKSTGIVKISGRAFFSSIDDSFEINKIIRMIDGE